MKRYYSTVDYIPYAVPFILGCIHSITGTLYFLIITFNKHIFYLGMLVSIKISFDLMNFDVLKKKKPPNACLQYVIFIPYRNISNLRIKMLFPSTR